MFEDTLWIYTSIAGACLGAAALFYIKDTRIGLWGYAKFDALLDHLINKFGWTWLKQDPNAWKKVNPQISQKLQELEVRIADLEEKT